MKNNYEVSILGQKFVLKTENDEAHVKRVADYVNKVMHSIKEKSATISTQNVAILGALNIAEEFFSYKDSTNELVRDWRDQISSMIEDG